MRKNSKNGLLAVFVAAGLMALIASACGGEGAHNGEILGPGKGSSISGATGTTGSSDTSTTPEGTTTGGTTTGGDTGSSGATGGSGDSVTPPACTAKTACANATDCGVEPDGCGGYVTCAVTSCPSGQTCGGGGTMNVCGASGSTGPTGPTGPSGGSGASGGTGPDGAACTLSCDPSQSSNPSCVHNRDSCPQGYSCSKVDSNGNPTGNPADAGTNFAGKCKAWVDGVDFCSGDAICVSKHGAGWTCQDRSSCVPPPPAPPPPGGSAPNCGSGKGQTPCLDASFGVNYTAPMAVTVPDQDNPGQNIQMPGVAVKFTQNVDVNTLNTLKSIHVFIKGSTLPITGSIIAVRGDQQSVEFVEAQSGIKFQPGSSYTIKVWGTDDPTYGVNAARSTDNHLMTKTYSRDVTCGSGKGNVPCE